MGNYATVDEIKAFKVDGEVVDLGSLTDPEIEVEITLVEEIIEGICNDIFYAKDETNRFNGNGLVRIFFKPVITYPLISVVSVKDIDIDGTELFEFTEGEDFVRFDYYLEGEVSTSGDFYSARDRSGIRDFGYGEVWPLGQNNIAVEGSWGREEVPAAIKRATILLTLEGLIPGSTSQSAAPDVSQVVWNDFTISFKAGGLDVGDTTGYPAIDRLLYKHINWLEMFNIIPDRKGTYDNWPPVI